MARAAERTAPTMNDQNIASTFIALSKVEATAGAMSPAGWGAMARTAEHIKLGHRMKASKTLWKILTEVRESHSDFRPRDAATACHRLAMYVGKRTGKYDWMQPQTIESDQDKATYQLALQAAKRTASGMNAQEVSNTLWAFGTLSAKGMEIDVAAVRAVSRQVPRVAGEMNTQSMVDTLWGIVTLAEMKAAEVDLAALRAAITRAPLVADGMRPPCLSKAMWAMGKLAVNGVEVDAAAVRAVSEQAPLVADEMTREEVSLTLWAIAQFEQMGVEVDAGAKSAVTKRAVIVRMLSGPSTCKRNHQYDQSIKII